MAVTRQNITDAENNPENVGTKYSVRNPHPGHGIDENIINEFGHTRYPKWVDHPTEKETVLITTSLGKDQSVTKKVENDYPKRVLVQNEEEEKALLSKAKGDWTKDKK